MTKIGVILNVGPYSGGKYQYAIAFTEALNSLKNKYKITFLTKEYHWYINLKKMGVNESEIVYYNTSFIEKILKFFLIKVFDLNGIIRNFPFLFKSNFKIKKLNLDILIAAGGESIGYQISKVKSIIPIFDLMHKYESYPELNNDDIYKWREKHYSRISKWADIVLVDSNLGKNQYFETYNRNNSQILEYIAPDYIRKSSKKNLGYNNEFVKFFYPAQFWEHKNHIKLILACKKLLDSGISNWSLTLTGSKKNNYYNIVRMISEYQLEEFIFIKDYVSNEIMLDYYTNFSCLIFVSNLGPTNIPPIESLTMACPMIISDVYAMKSQIKDSALYIDPESEESIFLMMKKFIKSVDVRKDLVKNGKKNRNNFTLKRFSNDLDSIINLIK